MAAFNKGDHIGISHVTDARFTDDVIRTPLGWYLNHSSDPSCHYRMAAEGVVLLVAARDLRIGDELTVTYGTFTNPPIQ